MRRISVGAVAASALLLVAGCASEANDANDSAAGPSSSPSASATSTPPNTTPSATVDYPVPPGAEAWPVMDVEACSALGAITKPELVVRVPVATPECIQYPEDPDVLVTATGEAQVAIGKAEKVDVPGFDGIVESIRGPISRGAVYSAQPSGEDVTWLVVWDGGTDTPIGEILEGLLVP